MQLLVSVRSAEEAAEALAGGASLIDVKEPRRGPLGCADEAVIRAVVERVGGRRPVSAALGELPERGAEVPSFVSALAFVKWGLAGRRGGNWQADFLWSAAVSAALAFGLSFPGKGKAKKKESGGDRRTPKAQAVLVAYADAERAAAPSVEEILDFACRRAWPVRDHVLLLDTFDKRSAQDRVARRPTLLDWLSVKHIVELCERCRAAGVRVALAGSLGMEEIRKLLSARPDWFAVRGAACAGHDRQQQVSAERVRSLVDLLSSATGPPF